MRILFYMATLVLVACGQASGHNSDYVRPQPQETSANFELWYNVELSEPFIDRIEAHWLDVQACAGIAAPAQSYKVRIDYWPREEMPENIGVYYFNTKRIIIDDFYISPEWDFILRHELIHHLLHITGHSIDQNAAHEPDWMFNDCIYSDWGETTDIIYYPPWK